MRRNEYLQMLYQDNETEEEKKKELYAAVLECAVEALSQENDDFDADQSSGQSISVRLSGLLICSKKYRRLRAIAASRICCEVV